MFPYVEINKLWQANESRKTILKENIFVPDPEMFVKTVTSSGLLEIEFNQEMLLPDFENFSKMQLTDILKLFVEFESDVENK